MFGRDLVEQVHADARGSGRNIPVIVEKCLQAVEASGESMSVLYVGTCFFDKFARQVSTMKASIVKLVVLGSPKPSLSCLSVETTTLSIFWTERRSTISLA